MKKLRWMLIALAFAATSAFAGGTTPAFPSWPHRAQDQPRLELVMKIVVTCSSPENVAATTDSKDGQRTQIWPIIGGRFFGKDIRGTVIPGGGDFPVTRPDGVEVIDALYRLKTDDGVTIIIHNKGLVYPGNTPEETTFRLAPEFIAPQGKYDWLNRNLFVSTLIFPAPDELAQAQGAEQNDRVIEVYRVY